MATSASATQIGISDASTGPVPPFEKRAVRVFAGAGANHVTVNAARPGPEAGRSALMVTVKDPNAVFSATPPEGFLPCRILDPHTARCTATPGTYFTQVYTDLGDGDNRLRFAPDSLPLREDFVSGSGKDDIATGPFVGDASWRWASSTGAGNDRVVIGPSVSVGAGEGLGLALYAGPGDDTISAFNGAFDAVNCGDGADTLIADPFDREVIYVEPEGSCETRVLPSPDAG
jgi:hypothetical protein